MMSKISKKLVLSLIVVTILLVGSITLAFSYAMWNVTKEQTNENVVESGCLNLEIQNEENAISLNNAYPITDSEASRLVPYKFTIKNTCTIASKYKLNLEMLNGTNLNLNYVATKIDNEEKRILGNITKNGEKTINNSVASKTIKEGMIAPNKSTDIELRLWMDESVELSNDAQDKTLNAKLIVIAEPSTPLCIRASRLHTEVCDSTGYCSETGSVGSGSIITYGNKDIEAGKLHTGDAFTCDVNGDGIYDEDIERFYYVNDLYIGGQYNLATSYDSDYAVLIYYSNTLQSNGKLIQNNNISSYVIYDSTNNISGPRVAVNSLPTTNQWPNAKLKSQTRQIYTESGLTTNNGAVLPLFTYEDKVARLITHQEIKRYCGDADYALENCRFLMENTMYVKNSYEVGYWLENSRTNTTRVWLMWSANRTLGNLNFNAINYGVRPVIEVLKTDISI